MTGLLQDVRLALRGLVKNRGFAAAAGLNLALGIGPNTALFTVLHAVLLRRLPYPEPERLVVVWETMRSQRSRVTPPDLVDWKAESRSFSTLAAREGRARVGVINETMARRYWSDQDPIGARSTLDDGNSACAWPSPRGRRAC